MKNNWNLESSYAQLPKSFYTFQSPGPVAEPSVVLFNEQLAKDLGLEFLSGDQKAIADYFSGNVVLPDSQPLAQAYAGHQFGHFTMLGDGRAILLGEHITPDNQRIDIQLKGSGETPYSRRGDGRATLYSMLREYLISEAMHHLGIPTTRSLAVVKTGEEVFRGEAHEGAILTRIAQSHIRVGTFEYARNFRSIQALTKLTEYTINRHFPSANHTGNPAIALLKMVMSKQIDLVVNWMRVGFIHGVMNTDNMSIPGETIDYGPCAFMNAYDPKTVYSSIDAHGRYAFANQQFVAHWNLSVFAGSLLPMISDDQDKAIAMAKEALEGFQSEFNEKWYAMMFDKLGILEPQAEHKDLVENLIRMMELHKADYTQVFVALEQDIELDMALFKDAQFKAWKNNWKNTTQFDQRQAQMATLMRKTNPRIIPRNHWVENVLDAAVDGDMQPFNELLNALETPYGDHNADLTFPAIPVEFEQQYQTFCGT